jgi:hypothetical protein
MQAVAFGVERDLAGAPQARGDLREICLGLDPANGGRGAPPSV